MAELERGTHVDEQVTLIDLSKSYSQGVLAVSEINLSIRSGEFVTVLGPSGSGKSTLLHLLAGALTPDSGRIYLSGKDVTNTPSHRRNIGLVFQQYSLFPNRTVRGNVAFPLEVRNQPRGAREAAVTAMLELVGLSSLGDRYPSQISGGQAQRVALARALVFGPAVMLMDEPLGALDRALRRVLQAEIRRIQRATSVPMLYVTHDQEEAMSLADRVVVMRDGKIVAQGSPAEVYDNPGSLWVATFVGDANCMTVNSVRQIADGCVSVITDHGLQVEARISDSVDLGSPCAIVVRPERCNVDLQASTGKPHLAGRVLDVTYLGPTTKLTIDCDHGQRIVAALPGWQRQHSVGDRVFVNWDPSAAVLVGM